MSSFVHVNPTPTRSSTPASQQSSSILDASSNAQSSTQASTPPTMPDMPDSHSTSSMTPNQDADNFKVPAIPVAKSPEAAAANEEAKEEGGGRERRRRSNVTTYNLKVLSGTAVHSPFTKNGVRKQTRDRLPEHIKIRVPRVYRNRNNGNLAVASAASKSTSDVALGLDKQEKPVPAARPSTSNATPRAVIPPSSFYPAAPAPVAAAPETPSLPSNCKQIQTQQKDDDDDDDDDDEDDGENHDEDEDDGENHDEDQDDGENHDEDQDDGENHDEEDEAPAPAPEARWEKVKKRVSNKEPARRQSTRLLGVTVEPLVKQVLGKRNRAVFEKPLKSKRELLNLLDTKEYAGIDDKPVIHEVWSNGKLVVEENPKKKTRGSAAASPPVDVVEKIKESAPVVKKKLKAVQKVWVEQGLYVGQTHTRDWFKGMSAEQKKKTANMPTFKPTGFMPLPMWHGQQILHQGRNFKLPFDVCSPLAPGQPKPDGWKHLVSHRKNHLVGDAVQLWKDKYQNDDSKCICSIDDGCGEGCHNREMMYECDSTNCSIGIEHCSNRAWAELEKRRNPKTSNSYTIGVEVFKTLDRGFGVRANRCFEPHQIIVEYTGEIITEEECDRRMNEVYKNNDCYYLMSYEQNMILDATKGSVARFVNHSCNPNCNMVKWVVKGKPRIALFALDRQIMTGEELTYDYNFNPFAANNVQECRCGSENCRGIVGPRPKGPQPQDKGKLEMVKNTLKAVGTTTKRKLKELMGQDEHDSDNENNALDPKKRKFAGRKPGRPKGSAARAFAASVQTKLVNVSKAVLGGGAPSSRAQRAMNKDSSLMSTSPASPASTSNSESSTGLLDPLQVMGRKGQLRTLITDPKGNTELSRDEKRKSHGWGGVRQKGAKSVSSSPAKSISSAVAKSAFKNEASYNRSNRTSAYAVGAAQFYGTPLAQGSRASSSAASSSPSHIPNIGEARLGLDEERDMFVSGTIRHIRG